MTCNCCSGEEKKEIDYKLHWNKSFDKNEINTLGWYEENPQPSLELIKKCNLNSKSAILNVGAGASTLIDELIAIDFKNIIANDLSSSALSKLKERLGENSSKVTWIEDDIINPNKLNHLEKVDLWHDRAVLHFFNDLDDQDKYFNLVRKLVKKDGYVIIAAFNMNGATKCNGLPVYRYNELMIKCGLGKNFKLIESFNYTYTQPSGNTREYVYTLFQKTS